jgi:small neutral amino acid transporter SnatA (MarC family)
LGRVFNLKQIVVLSLNPTHYLFSTIPVKKLVEKWGLSIIKRLMELILWDIAQFLVN